MFSSSGLSSSLFLSINLFLFSSPGLLFSSPGLFSSLLLSSSLFGWVGGGGGQAGLHYTISGTPLASATRGDQGAKALRNPL